MEYFLVGVLERWLKGKGNRQHFRSVLDIFREFAGCSSFEELLGLEDARGVLLRWRDSFDVGSGGYSPGTVNAYVSRVKSFYSHFDVELGRFPRHRTRVLNPHKVLTVDEIKSMIRHSDIREKALIWLLYCTGARINSILCLTVGRIAFRSDPPVCLHFHPHETKFNVSYDTFICGPAMKALDNYINWRKRRGKNVKVDSPLFLDKYNQALTYRGSLFMVKQVAEKAGIVIGDNERLAHHSFRAAFHRNLQVAGVNQFIIEKLMGHSMENTTTGRYSIGLSLDDLKEAYSRADWNLDIDEIKVRELEEKMTDTQRILGVERIENRRLIESYENRISELEESQREMEDFQREILRTLKLNVEVDKISEK